MLTNTFAQRVNVGVDVDMNGSNGSYQLCIGDVHEVNGVLGVVFAVSKDGRHGKVVSLSQRRTDWYTAANWCENLGRNWRLPTTSELQTIYGLLKNSNQFWGGLSFADEPFYNWWYWSSNEDHDGTAAEVLNIEYGSTRNLRKDYDNYVRAVCAF